MERIRDLYPCSEWESRPIPEEPEVRFYLTICTDTDFILVKLSTPLTVHTQLKF